MAQTFDVQLRLTADGRGLVVETAKAKQVLQDTGKSGKQAGEEISQGWSRAKTSILELGRAAAAAVGIAGLSAVMATSVGQAKAFEVGMAEVSTLLDDTSSVDGMTQSVRELAREYGQAPAAQAKALYQIISAGASDAAAAVETLDVANKLALGGITSVETAADGLTTVLNAYGPAAGAAIDVSDRLFVAMKAGKTTIDELSRSIGVVAPIASQAGVSLDELLASSAALAKVMDTGVAMQGLRAAIAAILKPSAEATELAGQLGLQFDAAALQSQGLAQFLDQVREKTGGSAEQLAVLFGGVEALSPMMALTGEQAADFASILANMGSAAGQTEAAVAKMQATSDQAFKRLAAEVGDRLLGVGNTMLDVLAPAALLLAENLTLVATVIAGRLVVAAAAAIPVLAAKTAGLTAATIATRGLAAAMTLVGGPVGIAVMAISALAVAALSYEGEADAAKVANIQLIRSTELLAKAQGAAINPALESAKAQRKEAEAAIEAARAKLELAEAELALAEARAQTGSEALSGLESDAITGPARERVQALRESIADLQVSIGFLNVEIQDGEARADAWSEELEKLSRSAGNLGRESKELATEIKDLNRELEDLEEQRRDDLLAEEEAAQGLRQLVWELQREAGQVGMTRDEINRLALARQLANFEAMVGTALSREQVEALKAEAVAAYDLRVAKQQAWEASEELADRSAEAARESAYAWEEFTGRLVDAVFDGTESVKDLFKRMLRDLLAQIAQSGLLQLISGLFGGSIPGLALAAGQGGTPSLLGSLFGGNGGGSAFGGASFLPVAGAVIGGGYGLTQRGSSTGSLGSLAAGAAYGTAGYIGGTIAYGATLGATAGAGTAAGVAGGAASGALGAAGAIPVVGWVVAAIAAIDMITGGKVFGTRYRPESSETSVSIGAEGGRASASVTEVRQRALFQGRKWRTRDIAAGEEAEEAAVALFDSIANVMAESARALEVEAPPVIDASIRTIIEYDKKGKEKARKILVDVLGRTWEEATAELAATRITAEAIIQTVDSALGGIAEGIANSQSVSEAAAVGASAGSRIGEEYGLNYHKAFSAGAKDAADQTAGVRGEASAIAERWRGDAEALLAGAQFLLVAATDIRRGAALLGDESTLTAITELTEELAVAGEPLLATYQRMVGATALLDQALAMSGVQLDKSREDVVRWATGVAEAAGGLDRVSALTNAYFETFYTAAEKAQFAMDQANAAASREFTDIGLDFDDFRGADGAQKFRQMFEAAMPTLSEEAYVAWLEAAAAFGIVIDLTAQYADVLGDTEAAAAAAARSLREFMDGIEAQIADLAPPATFADRLAAIQAQTETNIETARSLGATEADINRIRHLGQLQLNEVLAEQAEAIARYNGLVQELQDELDGALLSPFQAEVRDINRWAAEATAELNSAAQAAGMLSATEQDLMLVRDVANARMEAAIQRLTSAARGIAQQLYGTELDRIEAQIAAVQQSSVQGQLGAIAEVGQAATDMYERQRASIQSIQDWLDQQLLGDLSTLTPEQRLEEARAQFEALAAAAAGGDLDALAQLPAAATALLREGRDFWASSEPYTELEAFVRGIMEGFANTVLPEPATPGGGPAVGGGGPAPAIVSPELAQLYQERDALLAQLEEENRLALATQLATMIRDLVAGTEDSLADVAASIGISMGDLVADLGVNLSELNADTALALAGVASQLGVDLSELAANVGVDLGSLGDRQSLLNQALDATLLEIPDELRERLLGPLDDVRSAVTEADANAALEALKAVTEGMPPGIRNLLAPFFENIDPAPVVTELSTLRSMDAELALQTGHLAAIDSALNAPDEPAAGAGEPVPLDIVAAVDEQLNALWSQDAKLDTIAATLAAIANFDGVPGYETGTRYVPRTGPAILHEAEMVLPAPVADFVRQHGLFGASQSPATTGANIEDQVRELRAIRETLDRRLERLERRLERVESAERDGAREISAEFRRGRDDVLGRRG